MLKYFAFNNTGTFLVNFKEDIETRLYLEWANKVAALSKWFSANRECVDVAEVIDSEMARKDRCLSGQRSPSMTSVRRKLYIVKKQSS